MVKRRDLIRLLEQYGLKYDGGTNHDKFKSDDGHVTHIPRYREIPDKLAKSIIKQAGIEIEHKKKGK